MEFVGSITCAQCGSPVGTSSGRCPFCGAELGKPGGSRSPKTRSEAAPVGYSEGALRYQGRRAPSSRSSSSSSKPILLVASGVALLAIGAVAFVALRGGEADAPVEVAAPPPPPPKAAPDEITIAMPSHVDPAELSPAVQYRARAWNPSARLLSISASPVVETHVDLEAAEAKLVFTYLSGKQDPALAPSPNEGRFIVTVEKEGAMQASFPSAPGDSKALVDEPLCVFSAAMRSGRASGIPADEKIDAKYEWDSVLRRAVWTLTVPGKKELTRYVDGQSCAIVTRR